MHLIFAAIVWVGMIGAGQMALAAQEARPLHFSGNLQVWDRKTDQVELIGNAIVRQEGESLTADYVILNSKTKKLNARGNCQYMTKSLVMRGEKMDIDLNARTGVLLKGRVSDEKFSLAGDRIERLSETKFKTQWGEYSTCWDCPQSWAIQAESVELEFDGYAFMDNVTIKIKDSPALWLPYLVVPIKTRRQTGFLFPSFRFSGAHGFVFVMPFFWATGRSTDMTFGAGTYSKRGTRLEWEGRYALGARSVGQANFWYMRDRTFKERSNRWALDLRQSQELAEGLDQKLKVQDVSDNIYPTFIGDVNRNGESYLSSDLIFSYSYSNLSSYLSIRRFRNLLNASSDPTARKLKFDPSAVQQMPKAFMTTNDQFLFGSAIATGLSLEATNFSRGAGSFSKDGSSLATAPNNPGVDPIRKATRASMTPSLYTTLRPFDAVSLVPSLQYRGYFYSFHNDLPGLNRGYLQLQVDLSTQLERIYSSTVPIEESKSLLTPNSPRLFLSETAAQQESAASAVETQTRRIKHLIRPTLKYSLIPYIREDEKHPFIEQTRLNAGYKFDNNDIVPYDNSPSNVNYYYAQGNALAYGFTSQLVKRQGGYNLGEPTYAKMIEWSAGQAINFREYHKDVRKREPFSRIYSLLDFDLGRYTSSTTYYYYPYFPGSRQAVSTMHSYAFERSIRQRVLTFDRSVSFGYAWDRVGCTRSDCGTSNFTETINYSLSDYFLPSVTSTYSFLLRKFLGVSSLLQFQSPSRCWKFSVGGIYSFERRETVFSVDLALNLTGDGFGSVSEFANQSQSR